jgi:hypothetical protein
MFDPFPQRVHAFNLLGHAPSLFFFPSYIWIKLQLLSTHHPIARHLFLRFLLILFFYSFPAIAIQDTTAGLRPKSLLGVDGCPFGRVFRMHFP